MQLKIVNRIVGHGELTGSLDGYYYHQPLPAAGLDSIDPFLLLHHHGPMVLPPDNAGMPFGPHPHRGFETLTVIIEGDLTHKDSKTFTSNVKRGGAQWMTAGRGIVHNEYMSDELQKSGGPFELLQLWINLPARLKMTEPNYVAIDPADVVSAEFDDGRVTLQVFAGQLNSVTGPHSSLTDIDAALISVKADGKFEISLPESRNLLLYQLHGDSKVNGAVVADRELILFEPGGDTVTVESERDSLFLYAAGDPIGEPVASYGPFVMNTNDELRQAILDFQNGKMGVFVE